MEYSCSYREVLAALRPSYKSIDLRAILVALGDGQGWRCLSAIIRFSDKSPQEVEERLESIKSNYNLPTEFLNQSLSGGLPFQRFRGMNVELSAYSIQELDHITARLNAGILNCRSRSFHLGDKKLEVDLDNQRMSWRQDPYAADYRPWSVYFLGKGQRYSSLIGDPDSSGKATRVDEGDLNSWARQAGLSTFRDACERLLEANWGSGEMFEIRAPIYARIDQVHHLDQAIRVQGQFHTRLGALSLECSVSSFDNHSEFNSITPPQTLGRVQVSPQTPEDKITPFSAEFSLDAPPVAGKATAVLFKGGPPRFDLAESSRNLQSGSPFFKVFTSFVPEVDIDEYLECLISGHDVTKCQLYKKEPYHRIDKVLEHVTNCLLALCHLNPAPLPPYDVLAGPLSAGSADILADIPEGNPLLVSCTMAMPDNKKVSMLGAARTAICQRHGWPEQRIDVLLVTGKPSVSQPHIGGISMLAAEDLKQIWEFIKEGNIRGARALFGIHDDAVQR